VARETSLWTVDTATLRGLPIRLNQMPDRKTKRKSKIEVMILRVGLTLNPFA
jgi:hypothetical protein